MGAHDFKLKKVPFSALKSVNINVLRYAAPKLALVPASRYNCDVKESNLYVCKGVKPECLCQVSLGLKEVQMGAHDFKLNKVSLVSQKTVNINVSLYAAPKLALVPASRYYCDVNWSYHNVCAMLLL